MSGSIEIKLVGGPGSGRQYRVSEGCRELLLPYASGQSVALLEYAMRADGAARGPVCFDYVGTHEMPPQPPGYWEDMVDD